MEKDTARIRPIRWILLPLAAAVAFSCNDPDKKNAGEKDKYTIPDSVMRTLQIDTVHTEPLENSITLTGKVGFNEDQVVPIFPMVSGNVQEIKVNLGDYVKKGQVLAVIRSSEMAGFSNDLVNAETNVNIAEKTLEKTKDMYHSGLASLTDSLTAEVGYQQAKSELNRVKRVLNINGGNTQGDYVVRSPINGFIVQKLVTNNMVIRGDNNTNLFTISDLHNVWIQANVYESNISLVHTGDRVDVSTLAYPGRIFKGRVDKILNVLDPTNKVMKVRIVLANPDYLLKPEMYASITVTNKENRQALSIAKEALIFDHSQYYVLIFGGPADVRITPVQVINTVGDRTFIATGLNSGDRVIASQAILIYEALNS
jgi:cobalt-zinc-cadmium efflux system membrane fusion protein